MGVGERLGAEVDAGVEVLVGVAEAVGVGVGLVRGVKAPQPSRAGTSRAQASHFTIRLEGGKSLNFVAGMRDFRCRVDKNNRCFLQITMDSKPELFPKLSKVLTGRIKRSRSTWVQV